MSRGICRCGIATGSPKKPRCRDCHAAYMRAYRKVHPENREVKRRWRLNNPTKHHNGRTVAQLEAWRLRPRLPRSQRNRGRNLSKYGLTVESYGSLLTNPDGVCAICKKPNRSGRKLAVDHDHATERVRGLLCGKCNVALGLMCDDAELLLLAVEYLRRDA